MDRIAQNVTEAELAHGERIFAASTGTKNVVSIEGSVLGGWYMLPRTKGEVSSLAADLLDAGTKSKGKDAIREAIASRGASLSFRSDADRTYFSGSCFPEDLPFLLNTAAECLAEAAFPGREIENAKKRLLGELEESLTRTRAQAAGALSRMLYGKDHVNYADPTRERMRSLAATTRADVVSFHKKLSRQGLVLAVTGDIESEKAMAVAKKAFGALPQGSAPSAGFRPNTKAAAPGETLIPIKDKANIDVFFGAPIRFTCDDPEYLPLITLSSMLGGRGLSTGHLMRTIRERDGYTYDIRAALSGFTKGTHGMFRIAATFSPDTFEEAVAATKKEIGVFLKSGVTEAALETKKGEMTGNYLIGLSTTHGLAEALHALGAEGKPLSYLDDYPHLVRAVRLSELKELAPLIRAENLSLAASGTFPRK